MKPAILRQSRIAAPSSSNTWSAMNWTEIS